MILFGADFFVRKVKGEKGRTRNFKEQLFGSRSLRRVIGLLHILLVLHIHSYTAVDSWTILWATHSLLPLWEHGCTVGVNRDPPVCFRCPGSMASVAERQPYVRRWRRATDSRRCSLYTCAPAPLLDLVVFAAWSTSGARLRLTAESHQPPPHS